MTVRRWLPLTLVLPLALFILSLVLAQAGAVGAVPVATATATPPPGPGGVNHFQCYDVGRQPFDRFDLGLDDDLGPSTVEVRRPKLLCAPVDKNAEDPSAPNDLDHLVGYEIRRDGPRFEGVHDEIVVDQFGTLLVDLRRPERILVPSAKSLNDPATPLDPPVVDHYLCYSVRGDRRRVAGVTVEDQFGTGVTDVKKPLRLCVPTDKDGEGVLDNAARLMCYKTKPGPRVNQTVFIDNQFGAGSLNVRRARELCVPVATGPTPASSASPTATPTATATAALTPTATPTATATTTATATLTPTATPTATATTTATATLTPTATPTATATTTATATLTPTATPTATATTTATATLTPTATETPNPVETPTTCSDEQPCPGGVECCGGTCLPPDAFCRGRCSVTTEQFCSSDGDCRLPNCAECFVEDPNQTCVPGFIVPNHCGGGTCLTSESCCAGSSCCRNDDEVYEVCSAGVCQPSCRSGTFACGQEVLTCCLNSQLCVAGTCKTSCGPTSCFQDTETCCGDVCCDSATQICGSVSGTCRPRQTCTGTDVYIPSQDLCCAQADSCGTSDCCARALEQCDIATGQCVPKP